MSYLYGDSTRTDLKSNFLEFLRDAVDFAVFVLEADAEIKNGKVRIQKNTEAMEAEIGRLQHFIGVVTLSIRGAEKGSPDSATAACATHVEKLVAEAERTSVNAMRARLAQYIANVDAEEQATRAACFKALATLLAPHDPPDAETVTRLVLLQSGTYDATVVGRSAFGLAWMFALAIPDGSLWSSAIRLERIAQHFEIHTPQLSGWISKEVKVRPQRLDKHVVTEVVFEQGLVRMKLRAEPGVETGFDFSVDPATRKVDATRTGPADADASVGPFDVGPEDAVLIVDLAEKLSAGAVGLTRREMTSATWRDGNFHEVPTFIEVVEKLVAMMAPITREISSRSLKPTELVLRRMLGNDRREEVFVEKATLREKYETLVPPLREYFRPLGFDPPPPPSVSSAAVPAPPPAPPIASADSERPAARAELARSQRPPPPRPASGRPATMSDAPVLETMGLDALASTPPDSSPTVDVEVTMTGESELSEPPPSEPPGSEPAVGSAPPVRSKPASAPPAASKPPSNAPVNGPSNAPPEPPRPPTLASLAALASLPKPPAPPPTLGGDIPPPPESSQNPIAKLDKEEGSKNVVLIAALKKIVSLYRSGDTDSAYREYEALFSSPAFADYRPEDQRQALKLMVLAKSQPPKNEVMVDAYGAALTRLEVLAKTLGDPVDLEMLGAAHVVLDDPTAANAAFARALEIERARNPSSDLIGRVMSRVASL